MKCCSKMYDASHTPSHTGNQYDGPTKTGYVKACTQAWMQRERVRSQPWIMDGNGILQ